MRLHVETSTCYYQDAAEDKVFAFGVDSSSTGTCYTVLQRDCLGYWDCSNPNGNAYYYRGEHLPGPPEPPPSPPTSPSPAPPPDDCVHFEFFEFTLDPGNEGNPPLPGNINVPYVGPGAGTNGRNVDVRQCRWCTSSADCAAEANCDGAAILDADNNAGAGSPCFFKSLLPNVEDSGTTTSTIHPWYTSSASYTLEAALGAAAGAAAAAESSAAVAAAGAAAVTGNPDPDWCILMATTRSGSTCCDGADATTQTRWTEMLLIAGGDIGYRTPTFRPT